MPISRRYIRTGSLVLSARGQVELELLGPFAGAVEQLVLAVFLFGIDDFDAGAAERAEQIVELVRRRDVGGQKLIDLVDTAGILFFTDGNELPHFIVFSSIDNGVSSSVTRSARNNLCRL